MRHSGSALYIKRFYSCHRGIYAIAQSRSIGCCSQNRFETMATVAKSKKPRKKLMIFTVGTVAGMYTHREDYSQPRIAYMQHKVHGESA